MRSITPETACLTGVRRGGSLTAGSPCKDAGFAVAPWVHTGGRKESDMTRAMLWGLGFSMIVGATGVAQAQPAPAKDRREMAQDRRELAQDRRETRDDWRDLKRLEGLLARFDAARAANDLAALGRLDAELRALAGMEVREGQKELARDVKEVRRDTREVRDERREARADVAQGRPVAAANDRRDLADDKRDRRDDVRDARVEAAQTNRAAQIGAQLQALAGRVDPASLDQRRGLHLQLIALAKAELKGDARERAEDRRELREDRQEKREDRRAVRRGLPR